MDHALGATVADLVRALKHKGIPLPHELSTYVVLSVCETLEQEPQPFSASGVYISSHGQVRLLASEPTEVEAEAETEAATAVAKDPERTQALIQMLGQLLVASAPGVPESLVNLVERGPVGGYRMEALHTLLEASLIPLNRDAANRTLARLVREATRGTRGRAIDLHDIPEAEVDRALDQLLGVDAQEASALRNPVAVAMPTTTPPRDGLIRATLRGTTKLDDEGKPCGTFEEVGLEEEGPPPVASMHPVLRGLRWASLAALVTTLGLGALLMWDGDRSWIPLPLADALGVTVVAPDGEGDFANQLAEEALGPTSNPGLQQGMAPGAGSANSVEAPAPKPPQGIVTLSTVPDGAQILLRVPDPPTPLLVEQGVAHEFVALPGKGVVGGALRLLVPADTEFLPQAKGLPVFELDFTALASAVSEDEELGPSLLRATALGVPRGSLGVIQVQMPKGYELYKFLGVTPNAHVGPLPADRTVELRVQRREYRPESIELSPERWQAEGRTAEEGHRSMTLRLNLKPAAS